VQVHYVGTLERDGSKFDSSRDRDSPFEFTIGQGVIEGWSLGAATMKVGALSRLTIAVEYGYGSAGSGPSIPGGATLVFEIELLDILDRERTKEEALAEAEALCATAGAAFKSGDFNAAIESYGKAVDIVEDKTMSCQRWCSGSRGTSQSRTRKLETGRSRSNSLIASS
jgi:FKBP-type peptidyl-prolyl cis-trans isomerase 2